MPRKPIDYSKTHFYKIVCNDTEIKPVYVGHTTDFTRENMKMEVVVIMKNPKCITIDYIKLSGIMVDGVIGQWY